MLRSLRHFHTSRRLHGAMQVIASSSVASTHKSAFTSHGHSYTTAAASSGLMAQGLFASTRISMFMQLPLNQSDFSAYTEIDLPSETRIAAIQKSGLGGEDWVAIEKVHGTNFGIYLLEEKSVRFAKRSGIMDPNENFFGYHCLIDEFSAQVRIMTDLLKQKYGLSKISKTVMNGELFGSKYRHPLVPKSEKWCTMPNGKKFPMKDVLIQREPFPQYSPEIHFFCFDVKYSVSGDEQDFVMLGYDELVEFCSKVPGLLYAKALVRGTLDECLAFDVENFITPIPALLGLGNYPLEGNLAEGLIIRHARRGQVDVESKGVSTIIKLRCSSFMELKHPGKQKELKETFLDTVRAHALKKTGEVTAIPEAVLPILEAAANALLLNHVSEGRLSNVISKIGKEPLLSGAVTKVDVSLLLAKDALKDFLKDVDEMVLNTSLAFRRMLISNCYFEAVRVVNGKWQEMVEEVATEEGAAQQELGAEPST